MAHVTIEVGEEQQRRARALAAAREEPEQDIYREAISAYLVVGPDSGPEPSEEDYEPLRRMLGMVEDGPADMSVMHDIRPTDST